MPGHGPTSRRVDDAAASRLQRLPPRLLRLERAGAGGMDTGRDLGATASVSELRYGAPLEPAPVSSAASHRVTFTRNAVGGERHLPATVYPGPCLVRAAQADLPRVVPFHFSGDQVIEESSFMALTKPTLVNSSCLLLCSSHRLHRHPTDSGSRRHAEITVRGWGW